MPPGRYQVVGVSTASTSPATGPEGRGVGTELAADSAMECAERVVADLGHAISARWTTQRHQQPGAKRCQVTPGRNVDYKASMPNV